MRLLERFLRALVLLGLFGLASFAGLRFGTGGLWRGLGAAHAVTGAPAQAYNLTDLLAVNQTLEHVRTKYVKPERINPRQMFVSALDEIQREVAPVIVMHDEGSPTVRVRVDVEEKDFRVDTVQGPWDVSARLREVFAFLQANLRDKDVDLREIEYAACNGILRTLDPHSVFLSPDEYKEMTLSTSGAFGGLGIVISMRDQMLTIMRPMPGTPASRAGLKRFDRIVKINNESTLNMPLDDAVQRLRGDPGSKVTVWIHRDGDGGWAASKPFDLVREEIRVETVPHRPLAPGIGYVRITQFSQNTADELDQALGDLRKDGPIKGLVLDLRSNPGGLLDQAAQVADRFLERGVIVATVGPSEPRDEKQAKPRGTEPNYPIIVLTNPASASASEIVAGALKNLERAVVVGQTSFGKGTVQLVFQGVAGNAALKLTIAEYLTPGDISIQGVGVTPDIELDPMTVDPLEMDLLRTEHPLSERDLSRSLSNGTARSGDRPWSTLRYYLPARERLEMLEMESEVDDEFRLDFPVKFARDLVGRLEPGRRISQLEASKGVVEEQRKEQMTAVRTELEKLGVDWSEPPNADAGVAAKDFTVEVTTDRPSHTAQAGEGMKLRVTVKNDGKSPIYRLRAITKSDAGYYDDKELVFGRVAPGESKTAETPLGFCETDGRKPGTTKPLPQNAKRVCRLPLNALTRQDVVKVRFSAEGGEPPPDGEIRPTVKSLPQPVFAYTYQVADNRPGNGDGQVAKGEGVTMYLTVKNVGKGRSYETQANIRNLTGDGLFLHDGRFDISNLGPGESRKVAFTFDVLDSIQEPEIKLDLTVVDRDLDVASREKLAVPLTKGGLFVNEASGPVRAVARAELRGQPSEAARVVGYLRAGGGAERTGRFGDFTRVRIADGRFGFVKTSGLEEAPGARPDADLEPLLSRSPPLLEVSEAKLATTDDHVTIQGVATDADRVLDTYIFVGPRKVFYQSNRNGADTTRTTFAPSVALSPGTNLITVVARENEDTLSHWTLVVRRDGARGEALPTPKAQILGADWDFHAAE